MIQGADASVSLSNETETSQRLHHLPSPWRKTLYWPLTLLRRFQENLTFETFYKCNFVLQNFFEIGSHFSGWSQTCNPSASASQVLGLQACITRPGSCYIIFMSDFFQYFLLFVYRYISFFPLVANITYRMHIPLFILSLIFCRSFLHSLDMSSLLGVSLLKRPISSS
jgi:hypothetical protein